MRTVARVAWTLCGLLMLGACAPAVSPVHVDSERDPSATFSSYTTYDWTSGSRPADRRPELWQGDMVDWRVRTDIDEQLAAKGYRNEQLHPDFLVAYKMHVASKTIDSFKDLLEYRERGGQQGVSDAYVLGYQERSLTVEIFDARTRKLVWRSQATALLESAQERQQIRQAITKMLATFPAR